MRRTIVVVALLSIVGSPILFAQATREAELQFKAGQHKQTVEGDLKGAIAAYQKVANGKDRALAARALVQIAECHRLLGDANARPFYERVLRDFSDQPEALALAREGLSTLGSQRETASLRQRKLTIPPDVGGLTVMPDGRLMGTDWKTGDLVTIDQSTGRIRHLVAGNFSDPDPGKVTWAEPGVVAPDLGSFAYTWYDDGLNRHSLRVLTADASTEPQTLVGNDPNTRNPYPLAWSSARGAILASLDRWAPNPNGRPARDHFELAWVSLANKEITTVHRLEPWRVERNSIDASLSPDGRFIAISVQKNRDALDRQIVVIPALGGPESEIVGTGRNANPRWTPDGSRLLFVTLNVSTSTISSVGMSNGRSTGAPVPLRTDDGQITLNGMTRSGSLHYTVQAQTRTITVVEMTPPGDHIVGPVMQVTDRFPGSGPSWSPDGRYIAFKRPMAGRDTFEMVVRSTATGAEFTYAPASAPMGEGMPRWRSATTVQPMANRSALVMVGTNGLSETQSTRTTPLGPASPDGQVIYSSTQGQLVATSVATGAATTVIPANAERRALFFDLSPDGRFLASLQSSILPTPRATLSRVALDGSVLATRDLPLRNQQAVAWTRDNRSVLVAEQSNDSLWRVVRVDTTGEQAPEFTGVEIEARSITGMSLSPDGRHLAFGGLARTTDVWVLDLPAVAKK